MTLDIRIPLGLLFVVIGVILTGYGLMTRGSGIYAASLGINLNLLWGGIVFAFGAIMLLLSRSRAKTAK